jgi:hypothetical protein
MSDYRSTEAMRQVRRDITCVFVLPETLHQGRTVRLLQGVSPTKR